MQTERLYYIDSHLAEFSAKVLECKESNGKYEIILDKTAFFPEGGGQSGDTGYIGDVKIFDTQISNGKIVHYGDRPLPLDAEVECKLNWTQRFLRMQNHSGEHIVSGIVYKLFGYDNVGFHMGEDITVDFSGELSKAELEKVERLANEAIYKNVRFITSFPSEDELKKIDYRSKLELTEDVRLVTVEGYDVCACCAPHVSASGEIGIIKILDSSRHRGGMRVHLLCGFQAVEDYRKKIDNLTFISNELCTKQNEAAEAFKKYRQEHGELKIKNAALQKEIVSLKASVLENTSENILIFEESTDMNNLRRLVLDGAKKTDKLCAGFCGNDTDGYRFAVAAESIDLREILKQISAELNGKGGGSAELIQGNISSTKAKIEAFFGKI